MHHKLIGAAWDEAPDSFWALIYQVCDVPDENLCLMLTHAGEQIHPCFNAGIFVTRPARGLLAQWQDVFLKWYRQPEFRNYYEKDQRCAIFIHQAVFSGVLLHSLTPGEMYELGPKINYPLHLYDDIPVKQQRAAIND